MYGKLPKTARLTCGKLPYTSLEPVIEGAFGAFAEVTHDAALAANPREVAYMPLLALWVGDCGRAEDEGDG